MLFYETYFEKSKINKKPLIWSQDKTITKFGQKKWASLFFGKVYENGPKIREKCYFMKLTFEKRNINKKPLIWSQDKIITKFGQKK